MKSRGKEVEVPKEKRYTIELTEHQLHLISACVEDVHRLLGGQCEMFNTVSCLDNWCEVREQLKELKPLITPELSYGGYYGWEGGNCSNERQRKFIAETYPLYREILHFFAVKNHKEDSYNVYESETLTCEEGGPLPIIKEVE